jgi:hypothetical protein
VTVEHGGRDTGSGDGFGGGAGVKGDGARAVRAGGGSVAQDPSPLPFVASLSQREKGIEGGE